jgi:hypothetical protein
MFLAIILILWCSSYGAAADNLDSLLDHAPGLSVYPQASVVTIFDRRTIAIDEQGRTHTRREFLCKLLDERAKSRYGDQSVSYEADEDTVIVEIAKTRLPSGQWIDPEKDAFTITSSPQVQWASAYSQLKQQNISFPGMDVGAAIYLVYRKEPKPGVKAPKKTEAGGIVAWGGYEPILEKTFVVDAAPGRSIRYDLQNGAQAPQIAAKDNHQIYSWQSLNCPQIYQEPNAVGLTDIVPTMYWTTFPDWEALGTYVADYFWEKVDTSQKAVEEFAKITAPDLKGLPALMYTANWLLWNIRDVDLGLGQVGYEPNTADRVWENKYGDPRDKAVLLTALLRAYGFAPIPVLVLDRNSMFSELPVLEQFTHIIVAVPAGSDTIWLDPTAEYYPPGILPYSCTYGKGCMLVGGAPLLLKIPAGPPEMRGAKTEFHAVLSKTGDLTGTVVCMPQGENAATARSTFKDQKAKEQDIFKQTAASRIAQGTKCTGFTVTDPADLAQPIVTKLEFDASNYGLLQDDLMLVNIPDNPFRFGATGFYPQLPNVRYPVQLPPQARATTEMTIEIPEGFTVSYIPSPLVIENPYIFVQIAAKQGTNAITWTQVFEIKADKVPLESYPVLRDAFERVSLPKNRLVILEAKKRL